MNELLEVNKRTIQNYAELAFIQRKPEEAVEKYQGQSYRQHNPGSADGPEPFIHVVKWLAQTYPSFRLELKRILAEGDLVVTHSHLIREPGDRGMAVVDIFRLETGQILSNTGTSFPVFPKSLRTTTRCFSGE